MNIEEIRTYCLSLPYVTEDMAFGPEHLLFRIGGRIFACCSLEGETRVAFKCDAELVPVLRDRYADIQPAWHWNKKYWNEFDWREISLPDEVVRSFFRHSYRQAAAKLTRKYLREYPEILTVSPDVESE